MPRRIAPPKEWDRDARMLIAGPADDTAALYFANVTFPISSATCDAYSITESTAAATSGRAERTFALPASVGGTPHGLSVRSDAILLTTSEQAGAPNPINFYESVFVLSTSASGNLAEGDVTRVLSGELFGGTQSMRAVGTFDDGSIVLASGTGFITHVTLAQLIENDWSELPPIWNANRSLGFDCVTVPNSHRVWMRNLNDLLLYDLDSTTGNILPIKVAQGSNLGVFGGFMAMSAEQGLHIVREHNNSMDCAYFSPALLGALTSTTSNPAPTRVLTSPEFPPNFDDGVSIYAIDTDASGGAWISEYRWDSTGEVRALHFSPEAMSEGGSQMPDRIITRPSGPFFSICRHAPGYGLFQR
jgi:hypothetical protein